MKLTASEIALRGKWVNDGERVVADEVFDRVEWLIANALEELGDDESGWLTLYRDPQDNRLWEKRYEESQMHGGGQPSLFAVELEDALRRYPNLKTRLSQH